MENTAGLAKHSFTIFTDSEGNQTIITLFPENNDMLTGDINIIDAPYTESNQDIIKEDWAKNNGDYRKNNDYTIVTSKTLDNDQELQSYLSKARSVVQEIKSGNYDYDICVTENCWGGNSNTVQKYIFDAMYIKIEVPKGVLLPGIDGKFYHGPLDNICQKHPEVCKEFHPYP